MTSKNKKNYNLWVKNYFVDNCSYQLPAPMYSFGIDYCQQTMFGKKRFFAKYFATMRGLDCTGGYFLRKDLRKIIDEALLMVFNNPAHVNDVNHKADEINTKYFEYAEKVIKTNFSQLSDKKLAEIYEKLFDLQERAHSHALITTWFIDSDGQDLTNKLIKIAEGYVNQSNGKMKASEVFSTLTTSDRRSLMIEGDLELLELALLLSKDAKTLSLFKKKKENVLIDDFSPEFRKLITKHYEKWKWFPFGYIGPCYEISHYLKELNNHLADYKSISIKIKKIQQQPSKIRNKKKEIRSKLKIKSKDQVIFEIGADIVFLKGYRKDCSFHGLFATSLLFKEICRRKLIAMNQIYVMTHLEIIEMLRNDKSPGLAELNTRLRGDVVMLPGSKVLSGRKATEFIKKIEPDIEKEEVDLNQKEFNGVCACYGKARGRVKIINVAEEMGKMEEGDIMVSHTTFPSLVPAMKKAAAIVTEDGGITCHAAIVSRELGTPCVTGIKLITKVVKDGDMVEVDADKGIVKIIK